MEDKKSVTLIIFGVLVLILMIAEMNYIRLYIKSNHVVRQGATVEAVVSEVKFASNKGRPHHIIYVDYEIDGTKYTHVNFGADTSFGMRVNDRCVAYYDINNPGYAVSQSSVDNYANSIESMGCVIVFAAACAYFGYTVKKSRLTGEGAEKGLIAVAVVLVLACIMVIKNAI